MCNNFSLDQLLNTSATRNWWLSVVSVIYFTAGYLKSMEIMISVKLSSNKCNLKWKRGQNKAKKTFSFLIFSIWVRKKSWIFLNLTQEFWTIRIRWYFSSKRPGTGKKPCFIFFLMRIKWNGIRKDSFFGTKNYRFTGCRNNAYT